MSEPRHCLEHGEFWSISDSGCPKCGDDGLDPKRKLAKRLRDWLARGDVHKTCGERAHDGCPNPHYDFDFGWDCESMAFDVDLARKFLER